MKSKTVRTWSVVYRGRRYSVQDAGPELGLRIVYEKTAIVWTGRRTTPGDFKTDSSYYLDADTLAEVVALAAIGDPDLVRPAKVAVAWTPLGGPKERVGVFRLDEFLQDNADGMSREDLAEIRALKPGQVFRGGGGAAPAFEVRAVRPGTHKDKDDDVPVQTGRRPGPSVKTLATLATGAQLSDAMRLVTDASRRRCLRGASVADVRRSLGTHPTRAHLAHVLSDIAVNAGRSETSADLRKGLYALAARLRRASS